MKLIYTIVFTLMFCTAFGYNATFEKLTEVNKCWGEQKDIFQNRLPAYEARSEREWIRLHLELVEHVLRNRNTNSLTTSQKLNREQCLDALHEYWLTGNFPVNNVYASRTPIFIDKYDNFCAVGYLLKASGYEHVSRMIAYKTNLVYVREMKYPELKEWAANHGFTVDELAWIQPGYPSIVRSKPIGKGVDGEINELFVDTTAGRLYAGGSFTTADSTVATNNITYITETGSAYTWHSMGSGVNGTVNAIQKFDDKIFAAGSFTMAGDSAVNNVAYWDGSVWHSAGCVAGNVLDLVVFRGDLYACGSFDVCGAVHDINFAKWDGSAWQPIPGLNGRVNTMEVMDTMLVLGGAFTYGGVGTNAIKWNSGTSFQPFANNINNEVKDFEISMDTMYAVCKHTHATDSVNLFLKLNANTWSSPLSAGFMTGFYLTGGPVSFNTLCAETGSLNFGGEFRYAPMVGTSASNCFNLVTPDMTASDNWFYVDSDINKMVVFNSDLIAGGKFRTGRNYVSFFETTISLNGIAKRFIPPAHTPSLDNNAGYVVYPDPVESGGILTIKGDFDAVHFAIRGLNAKLYAAGTFANKGNKQVSLPNLASGIYLLELTNENGESTVKKISVR